MRRTAAIALTASIGLLLAGCGSSNSASPAASSSSAKPSSSSAASSSTAASTSSSAAASSSGSDAPASANLGLAAWSSAFCTALVPLTNLNKLPDPDTSTPAAAKTSFVSLFTQVSVVLGQVVAGFDTVGPPPGGGSVTAAADTLNGSAVTLRDLTATLSATDAADSAALSSVITKAGDELSALKGTLTTLGKSLSAEVKAGLSAAPECAPLLAS